MHFTRVVPYKLAHLQHVILRIFDIAISVEVLHIFLKNTCCVVRVLFFCFFLTLFELYKRQVAGGDRGHKDCLLHPTTERTRIFIIVLEDVEQSLVQVQEVHPTLNMFKILSHHVC